MNVNEYLPNLIYIGPDKSGSTWLYNIFLQHRDIFVPKIKDIYFFDKYFDRGIDWYVSFFLERKSEKFICDISHDYLFSKVAAERIRNVYSFYNKRLILFSNLRNPIEKLWSHYLFLVRSGITNDSIMEAILKYPELIEESLYYKYVKTYKAIFGEEYKVFLFDDLKKDPKNFARKLFLEFGINWDPDINYNVRVLPASRARSFYLVRLARKLAKILRDLGYLRILGFLKNNFLINKLLFIPYEKKPEMPEDLKCYLWNKYFKEDIERLSELLKIDLINTWGVT